MTRDSLGDRMKRYERAYDHVLTPRSWVIVRVDGRSFHHYTRHASKPFDSRITHAMDVATRGVADDMQGFRLAYTQSDEATFAMTDTAGLETQPWFGNRLSKVLSITASTFTAYFNEIHRKEDLATFDARAFCVPEHDVPNVFVWRYKDCIRNAVQMIGQSHFSPKELHGVSNDELRTKLQLERHVSMGDFRARDVHGMLLNRQGVEYSWDLDYDRIQIELHDPEDPT